MKHAVEAVMHPALGSFLLLASMSTAHLVAVEVTIEAESSGCGTRIADPLASGGAATHTDRAWEPLIRLPAPPATLGDEVALWVRHRGGPLQAKITDGGGTQVEQPWSWSAPGEWTWSRLGTITRAAAAGGAQVIRGGEGASPVIDVARWTTAKAAEPTDAAPTTPSDIRVDWTQRIGEAGAGAYGLNLFRGWDERIASDTRYQTAMRTMAPGFIRFHTAEGMSVDSACSWLDHATRTWKRDKIAAVFAAIPRPRDIPGRMTDTLITIHTIPPWMDVDHDGFLDADQRPAWATLCADLVRIVNVDLHAKVGWWEISNEWDDHYHNTLVAAGKPSRMGELVAAYRDAAIAMKQIDPTIRTGGPGAIRPDLLTGLRLFVRGTADCLDFFSYHAYASGSTADSDAHIFGPRIQALLGATENVRTMVQEEAGRPLPLLLGEYNISWTWETRDARMTSHKGAVYDALAIAAGVTAGATATTAWNEMDGIYGKIAPDFSLRPQGQLFAWLNTYAVGGLASCTPSVRDAKAPVIAYAVANPGGRAVVLINRTNAPCQLTITGIDMAKAHVDRIDENGFAAGLPAASALNTAPRFSVTLIRE